MTKILLFLLLLTVPAYAQQTVITKPFAATTTILSSTIAVTNNFQTVIPAASTRSSCTIQNKSSNDMWIFFGPATSATKALSAKLAAGQSLSCIAGSIVLRDELAITGTAGDEFYAGSQ